MLLQKLRSKGAVCFFQTRIHHMSRVYIKDIVIANGEKICHYNEKDLLMVEMIKIV